MNRALAPVYANAVDTVITLPDIDMTTLQNKLQMYYYTGGEQEVFQIQIVFPAGSWSQSKPLQTLMTSLSLKSGTKEYSPSAFDEMIEFYGASLFATYNFDFFTITLKGLTKYLKELVALMKQMVLYPVFDENEFKNQLARTKQKFEINLTKADYVAQREFDKLLFGFDHPYGTYTLMSDFAQIHPEDILSYYHDQLNLQNATIFASGKLTENHIQFLKTELGSWQKADSPPLPQWNFMPQSDPQKNHSMTVKDKALQSSICVGRLMMSRREPDYLPMVVLNVVLGGYFGSRLMSNIREDKGYTYGIYSSISGLEHASFLRIATDIDKDKDVVADTYLQIHKEMNRLCEELVDVEELLTVKNYLLSSVMSQLDGPFKIMNRWKDLIISGFDKKRFDSSIETYRNVSASELMLLAQKYFVEEDLYHLDVS